MADAGPGGLSGAPLKAAVARGAAAGCTPRAGDRLVLIAAGGIETADDARDRLAAGATLLQAYTAFIYEGPLLAAPRAAGPGGPDPALVEDPGGALACLRPRRAAAGRRFRRARASFRPDQRCYVPVKGGREVLT